MRARLAPEDVGLPAGERRRRTPGLRIEEAAALAGVSLTWYTALERGSGARVSASLLERIGDALRLTSEEREHLGTLARPGPRPAAQGGADAWLQTIVDGFVAGPAYVSDRLWNVRIFNAIADDVYGLSSSPEPNLLVRMLLEPQLRDLHEHWERIARQMVEIIHLAYGREPEDPAALELVARLRNASPDFALWWDGYGLRRFVPTDVTLRHPTLGRLRLTYTGFVPYAMPSAHDWAVVVLQPAADAGTRAHFAGAIRRASRT
jgi:transcriptional regulator with XRE-family HTH domain